MDFAEFERLVLRVLFETNVPLTATHIAYLGGLSVKAAVELSAHTSSRQASPQ